MDKATAKKEWDAYCARELADAAPLFKKMGIRLATLQPHLMGERYLMSGRKLVLLGEKEGEKVVVKLSSSASGRAEIAHEHAARQTLAGLRFAYRTLSLPDEILYKESGRYTLLVTRFLPQEKGFIERPLEKQFSLALQAFKAQESIHATTYSHATVIRSTFGQWRSAEYLASFRELHAAALPTLKEFEETARTLSEAEAFLETHRTTIDQYSGFLTHADFLPHNLRVQGDTVFLLDQTSLRFGNKYESWARFLNFMTLYNPPLEKAFLQYLRDNRTKEEYESLRLMRIYKATFLISFYALSISKTEEKLHALTAARIHFWTAVLQAVLKDQPLDEAIRATYVQTRDSLRSEEERQRQMGLH